MRAQRASLDRPGSCITFVDTHWLRRSSFKGKRREIVETRVKACSVVVLHICLERTIQSTIGWKHGFTGKFGLERMKKRFGVCIVAWPPDAGTLQEAQLCYLRAKGCPHVLRAAITMEDHATPRSVTRCVYEHRARDRRSATVRQ